MLVAKQKRKENIGEYILYLYQIEDIIRAFQLDMNHIEKNLVTQYKADKNTLKEISNWYANLVIMMEKEGIREKGHFQFLINLIADLNEFHLKLLETEVDKLYIQNYQTVAGLITELKQKNKRANNDVQLATDSIYGFLLLKMKKSEISIATTEAIKRLSTWLKFLSKLYKDFEAGDLEF
jgi:hypothetical protein